MRAGEEWRCGASEGEDAPTPAIEMLCTDGSSTMSDCSSSNEGTNGRDEYDGAATYGGGGGMKSDGCRRTFPLVCAGGTDARCVAPPRWACGLRAEGVLRWRGQATQVTTTMTKTNTAACRETRTP